jgi:alkaline phosphatase D
MSPEDVPVKWRVAKDDNMRDIVQSGTATATAAMGHSVHVELTGLEPARWYWYQFSVGSDESPVGRTRTAPAVGASPEKLAFAFTSCQNWQAGYFTALGHMAKEDLDLVVHLGDYIYEGGISAGDGPRKHNSGEITSLTDYRNRYALYKSDPHLQAVHAAFPFVVTWDDHEVENNYANMIRENNNPAGDFRARRAAAYQAYYEHQPLRRASLPKGADMLLYRRLAFGGLAEFNVLDTRQYRTDQPSQEKRGDAANTLPGLTQEKWLTDGLDKSKARWNILAQQVFMAQRDLAAGPTTRYSMDAWDGYAASRGRILDFVEKRKPSNMVVLTGDVHANWVADLKADFEKPESKVLGSEFVGTSISSGGDGSDTNARRKTCAGGKSAHQVPQQPAWVRPVRAHAGKMAERLPDRPVRSKAGRSDLDPRVFRDRKRSAGGEDWLVLRRPPSPQYWGSRRVGRGRFHYSRFVAPCNTKRDPRKSSGSPSIGGWGASGLAR